MHNNLYNTDIYCIELAKCYSELSVFALLDNVFMY